MSFLKKYSDYLVIIILLIFTVSPLFVPGWFSVHDDEQIGRLFELNKDVLAGHMPPRLAQDLGFGFDYPLFNFYPSFVYYVAEIFHLVGFPFISSTKLMIGLGFILAGIFMYLFAKEYLGRIGGIVAAIAYSYAPYHSVDVYVRGALPEFWSFVFIPALFWSFHQLAKKGNYTFIILSGFFVACLALTHDLIAMMSSFFLASYFLFLIVQTKKKKVLFRNICLSILLGLGLSAYFWLPAYFEKQFTMVYLLTEQGADYHSYFVCIKQFINSPWGYGGSIPGCFDGLSFQVGQAQLLLAGLSTIVSLYFIWKKRKDYGILILFICMFLFSLFIQTKYSLSIWNAIQPFSYIQFPWRFLVFSDFTIAFIVGFLFSQFKNQKIQIIIASGMLLLLILLNKNYFQPKTYLPVTDANYIDLSVITWRTSNMSYEYTPKGIAIIQPKDTNAVINITKAEI
ncbi:MAG TPA: 6-pyruvoyl-tetrahydropterin synthase-related protein, partial [Candidatus Saccharimonadales bacterium]|nr:6-pyruvoyl-tetrahydropterin synthase-related protein [Candidatus Saccharimonadales bacterium]